MPWDLERRCSDLNFLALAGVSHKSGALSEAAFLPALEVVAAEGIWADLVVLWTPTFLYVSEDTGNPFPSS